MTPKQLFILENNRKTTPNFLGLTYFFFMCVSLSFAYAPCVCVEAHRGQRRISDPLEL